MNQAARTDSPRLDALLEEETGATTIEYTLVLAFVATISIYATIGLITVLLNRVAVLAVNIALFLTGVPSP